MNAKKTLVFVYLAMMVTSSITVLTQVGAWTNGPYTDEGNLPGFGTHDWIALYAAQWLPVSMRWWIEHNLDNYLLGTELPDNGGHPLGKGDVVKHHVYFSSSSTVAEDDAAVRAQEEYDSAQSFLASGNYSFAALHAGLMAHYIADLAVFAHVMNNATHHSDYENYADTRTNEYPTDDFSTYLNFDGMFSPTNAYDGAIALANDTTYGGTGGISCVWMEANYNWSDNTFKDRAGESLNLAANKITDVLHKLYSDTNPQMRICCFDMLFAYNHTHVIYPSENPTKPLSRHWASTSDWTSSAFLTTKLTNYTEGFDTDSNFVNQTSGKPTGAQGTGIVSFGGPIVNVPVYYYEVNKIAPVLHVDTPGARGAGEPWSLWYYQNGTSITQTAAGIDEHNDYFLIEVFKDSDGRNVLFAYGISGKGTYAAGKYFHNIYPDVSSKTIAWTIVKWEDTNMDGFVNGPNDGDTYTVIASSI
jgi:hypothetical protein